MVMALRDQPYIPLYVQDFLTDEKLMECSASATGVYIRIMCIMHKSEEYGTILLKQKDKQSTEQINNFASKIAKFLPYDYDTILSALNELLEENVLHIDGDKLIQKRMMKDGNISDKRALAGAKGGEKSLGKKQKNTKDFAQAKTQANSEYEYVYENENINDNKIKKENTVKTRLELDSIEVLEYLNLKANRKFEITTKSYLKNIQSRLKERNEKQLLLDIIDMKCLEWLNTDFEKYLSPSTLFNNEKFYKYVEQLKYAKSNPDKFIKFNAAETKGKSEMQLYKESLIRKHLQNEQQ